MTIFYNENKRATSVLLKTQEKLLTSNLSKTQAKEYVKKSLIIRRNKFKNKVLTEDQIKEFKTFIDNTDQDTKKVGIEYIRRLDEIRENKKVLKAKSNEFQTATISESSN